MQEGNASMCTFRAAITVDELADLFLIEGSNFEKAVGCTGLR